MYRSSAPTREFGVPSGPYTGTRVVDVRKLSEPVRRALADTLAGKRSPRPLIAARAWNVRALAGQGAAVAGIVLLGVVGVDLGALQGAWWTERGPAWAALYAFLVASLVVGSVVRRAGARREGKRPLPQGTFLLPLDLLVIEGWRMTVLPFGDARHVDIDQAGRAVTVTYADGRLVRVKGARATKASLLADLLSAQHTLEDATLAGKPDRDDRLGDLRASGWEGVLVTEGDAPAELPSRRRLAFVAAVAAVAGLLVWHARVRVDDELVFRAARALDTQRAYDAYLAHGTAHVREVETDLAPGVMLRDARRSGGRTDAYAAFLRRYPDGPLATQARSELDALCVERFRQETAVNEAQVDWFEQHNAECKIPEPLEAEVRNVHQAAELDTLLRSPGISPLVLFVGRSRDPGTTRRAQREIDARVQKVEDDVRARIVDERMRDELLALIERAHARGAPATVLVKAGGDAVGVSAAEFAASLRRKVGAPSDLGLIKLQLSGPADVTWSLDVRQEDSVVFAFEATRLDGGTIQVRRDALPGRLIEGPLWERFLGDQIAAQVLGFKTGFGGPRRR